MSYDAWKLRSPDCYDREPTCCEACGEWLTRNRLAHTWVCEDCDAREAREEADLEAWELMAEQSQ